MAFTLYIIQYKGDLISVTPKDSIYKAITTEPGRDEIPVRS